MALAPGPMIPNLYIHQETSSAEPVSNAVDMLINKSRIVNVTKKFGGEPNFIEDVPEKGSGSVSI